jgi:hypothetical protein
MAVLHSSEMMDKIPRLLLGEMSSMRHEALLESMHEDEENGLS